MPSKKTLSRYGLSIEEWQELFDLYDGACHVCRKVPGGKGLLFIDHEHVKGWAKMLPHERKKFVRGLACYQCNYKLLFRGITKERLLLAAQYLERYEIRGQPEGLPEQSAVKNKK